MPARSPRPCRPPCGAATPATAWGPRYAAAVARYAHEAWGWEIDTSAAMIVPDVMIGAAELLRLLTDEGGPVVVVTPGLRLRSSASSTPSAAAGSMPR